jgi:hypothetical protein
MGGMCACFEYSWAWNYGEGLWKGHMVLGIGMGAILAGVGTVWLASRLDRRTT